MRLIIFFLIFGGGAAFSADRNVILITFDGVRASEFLDPQNMPIFWSSLAEDGVVFSPQAQIQMSVSNQMLISLPAYQSIMAGFVTNCVSNDCGRIEHETLADRLLNELKLNKFDVATIASWPEIANAFSQNKNTVFINAGQTSQDLDPSPWGDIRLDKYTMAHATQYIEDHRPRFLFVSLNDSDNWCHDGKFENYIQSLKQYDIWLTDLVSRLKKMSGYGENTTIILTTDHGRGDGDRWRDHGPGNPEARHIWLYGLNIGSKSKLPSSKTVKQYTHIDLRPTIETILGLKPTECDGCGQVIEELVQLGPF